MHKFVLILAIFLPQFLKRAIYSRIMGWQIEAGAKIGLSFMDIKNVYLGKDVKIGHFNIIKNLHFLEIGDNTYIANFNHVFGNTRPDWPATLKIGRHVNFMSHHFIDVGGTIEIGDRVVLGGRDTHIWGHSLIYTNGKRKLKPLDMTIGQDAYIGARATLLGCSIPDGAIVGAGSVVTKSFPSEDAPILIAGNPAAVKKRYVIDSAIEPNEPNC
jgi:acetyltransferase-like isoleucine patch superfamily enzyme